MKKVLPYILIVLIVVQMLAPFTLGRGEKNDLVIQSNKAEAEGCTIISESFTSPVPPPTSTDTPRPDTVIYTVETTGCIGKGVMLGGTAYGTLSNAGVFLTDYKEITSDTFSFALKTGEQYCDGGDCNKIAMSITIRELKGDVLIASRESAVSLAYKCLGGVCSEVIKWELLGVTGLKTEGQTFTEVKKAGVNTDSVATLPVCIEGFMDINIGGCFAQLIYYALFKPTSFLFGLTGKILDFTLFYSISDTSYRSAFVVEGWGIVRDFCNMFFIFVLLYIAFGTILNLHSVKTKEAIINVVIIGLLINFSLFATHVIIDASNILTRVFYNQKTIAIKEKNDKGELVNKTGEFGEIRLSEAIVSKVDPQKLIIQAKEVGKIKTTSTVKGEDTTDEGISAGAFIIVVLLATIVNVVGMIAFISCAIIFIARVLGLWLAMILAPIAFFSYTVPALKDMKMIGWTKWWPDTLKMAFLAPIFAFFMYLIVGFMNKGLGIMDANSQTGMAFVVALVVPFVFIMLLLMKAKDIASNMSGEIGQSITKGIAAVGGVALGGAALGTAMLGRGAGNIIGKMSNSKGSQNRLEHKTAFDQQLEEWKKNGQQGEKPTWKKYVADQRAINPNVKLGTWNPVTRIGAGLNMAQRKANKVDKARDITDADIEKAGFKGMKWSNMSGEQQSIVKENVKKENYTKWMDEAEQKYRTDNGLNERDGNGKLADLTADDKEKVKNLAKSIAVGKFEDQIETATKGVNAFVRAFSKANTGTWDVRNLSNAKTDKRASVFTKIPVGLISAVATGVRGGILKNSGLSNGTVKIEGKFLNDLKSTLNDSLKNIKVELPESHGSENAKKVGHGSGH